MSKTNNEDKLNRVLSIWDMTIFGMLFVIPIAPFGIYGFLAQASNNLVPLVYLVGCFAMVFTAFSYGQMAQAFPIAGSVYSYVFNGMNPFLGFMTGWAILLDYILMPTLIYVVCGVSINAIFPEIAPFVWSVVIILGVTFMNTVGIEHSAKLAFIALIIELVIYFLFIAFALYAIFFTDTQASFTIDPIYNSQNFSIGMVMNAVSIAVLSFLGFDAISTLAEETKGSNKMVGRASILVLLIAGSLFVFITYIAGILWSDYRSFDNLDLAFYEIANLVGGKWLFQITSAATAFSWGFAALTAQLAVSRVLFSMSRDGNMPKMFKKIHHQFKTPYVATWFIGILSLIMTYLLSGEIELLSTLVNFGALSAFIMLHITVIYYYKLKEKSKSIFYHLLFPIIGLLVVFYVWINTSQTIKIYGTLWLIIGAIYYVIISKVLNKDLSNFEL